MGNFMKTGILLVVAEILVLFFLMCSAEGNLAAARQGAEEARLAYEMVVLKDRWVKVSVELGDGTMVEGYVPKVEKRRK